MPDHGHTGHLDYYTRYGINPVRYDVSDLRLHLDRRGVVVPHARVDAARDSRRARCSRSHPAPARTASISPASPREPHLVEPNPVAVRDIATVYAVAGAAPMPPTRARLRFEDYEPDEPFDVVVCENWLGSSDHERRALAEAGPDGRGWRRCSLVTAVSPVGMLPNLLRRRWRKARPRRRAVRRAHGPLCRPSPRTFAPCCR